jgi:hypothetical protein
MDSSATAFSLEDDDLDETLPRLPKRALLSTQFIQNKTPTPGALEGRQGWRALMNYGYKVYP